MHEQSDIKVTKIDRRVLRPGFADRFHCVTFEWVADGLVQSSFKVWVSPLIRKRRWNAWLARFCLLDYAIWPNWPMLLRFCSQKPARYERGATGARAWGWESAGASRRCSGSHVI